MLNQRELDIIAILARSADPLTASQIVEMQRGLTQSTVTAVLRKLLRLNMVEVSGVTHAGKVLSRQYVVTQSGIDAVTVYFEDIYQMVNSILSAKDIMESIFKDTPPTVADIKDIKKLLKSASQE